MAGLTAAVAAMLSAGPAQAAPCDSRPASTQAMEVWQLPTGKDLEFKPPAGAGVLRGTYRGDRLTVGVVYRNCSPGTTTSLFLAHLRIDLQGLGSAFRYEGVADAPGLAVRLSTGAACLGAIGS